MSYAIHTRRFAVASAVFAVVAASGVARADAPVPDAVDAVKQRCVLDHEHTQRLRLAGKLKDARAAATSCADDPCPALVRAECTRIFTEIEASLPSVVVEATEDGASVDGALDVDGASAAARLDGHPIVLDPGEHALRVRVADGRSAEMRIAIREGETGRRVQLAIPPRAVLPLDSSARESVVRLLPAVGSVPIEGAPRRDAVHWPAIGLGAIAVAGLGTFTIFGLRGYREQIELETRCAPACSPGSDHAMRTDYLVADIALGMGLAALGGAIYFLVTNGRHEVRAAATR